MEIVDDPNNALGLNTFYHAVTTMKVSYGQIYGLSQGWRDRPKLINVLSEQQPCRAVNRLHT